MYDLETRKRFRNNVIVFPSNCYEWTGPKHPKGYGMFSVSGKNVYAHRYIWEWVHGPIPVGYEIDHLCGNKSCVNPDHLSCTTHRENMRRAAQAGVWNGTKNGSAKRTEGEVIAIKIFAGYGVPVRKLSAYLDIPKRSVYAIINRECWAHLEPPPQF